LGRSQFKNIKACVFDAYGTLFDVHSAVRKNREQLGNISDELSALWRRKQLEYTWLRSIMRKHTDFSQVIKEALEFTFDTFGLTDNALKNGLLDAYLNLECYPEVKDTLSALKQRGLKTAILSNGSPAMLEAMINNSEIKHLIDLTLSVEEIGIYKPSPLVYQLAVERLGVEPKEISYQSSNAWDVAGAASFGLRVVWINRLDQKPERLPFGADAELKSLSDLPGLLEI
jgi:2-haloacid dehalogenase